MISTLSGTQRFHRELTARSIRCLRMGLVMMLAVLLAVLPATARAASLIRDPDIEYALERVAEPVLRAAGLAGQVRVLVVNDDSLNAFVIDNNNIYIHSGMLMRMSEPDMLQAVIAHEAAHITNGHLTRRMANLGAAQNIALLGLALAVAAGALTGEAGAAAGIALGSQSSAIRGFLSHTREEETAADRTGARYMAAAGVDIRGAVRVHEMFEGQENLNRSRQDPYMQSHPLTRDRLRAMRSMAEIQKGATATPDETRYWFDRARGKTSAFMRAPKWTMRRAHDSASPDITLMREAVAYHLLHDRANAIAKLDQAIAMRPDDAFFWELKGQILLESRQFNAAVDAYARAVELAPDNALCLGGLGRALLAAGRPKEALEQLEKSRSRDFRDGRVLRDLGAAYAQLGDNGMASLATAERYALSGKIKDAGFHATRAMALLPQGSNGWRRAQDIEYAAKRAEARKK
ncbi:M48 family metalloprotease [Shimia biformata]|uniref:M48 family metalloprotease n=1 Tax=Shimia biformata TaxID=1294299 RepID=UPI003B82DF36